MGKSHDTAEEIALAHLGKALRHAMQRAAVKRSQLAKRLGVTHARVSQILGADGSNITVRSGPNPTIRTLARLANALDCDLHIELRPRS
jgi:transcriptional regulator with XRE-family HTH domain